MTPSTLRLWAACRNVFSLGGEIEAALDYREALIRARETVDQDSHHLDGEIKEMDLKIRDIREQYLTALAYVVKLEAEQQKISSNPS